MYRREREVEQRKGRRVEGAEMEGKWKRKKGGGGRRSGERKTFLHIFLPSLSALCDLH